MAYLPRHGIDELTLKKEIAIFHLRNILDDLLLDRGIWIFRASANKIRQFLA
jgi:hypothetical protein